ncbi:MAG: T9SS type A sorting domain-containing protein, partial [Candidatus Coatesbacteria bacterium]|nr:T9SS type A sorting domain-containing protein [Candidatus Coatesbacteria bacterium]
YPNPFKDRLNIESPSSGAVYDITGRKVYSFGKGINKVDTNSWREGIYIVKYGEKVIKVVKVK